MAVLDQARGVAAQPVARFSQTAFIFAVIAFAFLVYVTIRGDLPKWLGLFGFGGAAGGLGGLSQSLASSAFSAPGTNTAGAALPDVLSGGFGSNVVPFPSLPKLGTVN